MIRVDGHTAKLQLPRAARNKPVRARNGRRVAVRRPRLVAAVALAVLLAVLVAGWFALRNSSLVAVREVRVIGLSGYYDRDARAAVVNAATQMTTLNFDEARIEQAAGQFADVESVHVTTNFPHAATIRLDIRRAVVIARLNGSVVALSQHGQVMPLARASAGLPRIQVSSRVVNGRVSGGRALAAAHLLGAAPDVLLRRVDSIMWGRLGIVVKLDDGPNLYFGDADHARAKWRDAAAVLASSAAKGAAYLDLRVPGRPAIGGLGGAPAAAATESTAAPGEAAPPAADASVPGTTVAPATQPAQPAAGTVQRPAQQQPAAPTRQPAAPATSAPAPSAAGGAAPGA